MKRTWLWLLFWLYTVLMLWLLFGQRLGDWSGEGYGQQLVQNLNLTPLATIRRFLWVLQNSVQPGLRNHAIVNLVGNVIMFLPLGWLLPALWKGLQKAWRFALGVLALILLVELVQLVTLLGTFDVDDILLNLVGALLGYGLWLLLAKNHKK